MSGTAQKGLRTPRKMAAMAKAHNAHIEKWRSKAILKVGTKSGKLTVLELIKRENQRYHVYRVKCDCGKETEVRACDFLSYHRTSCGCGNSDRVRKMNYKHGAAARGRQTPEHIVWSGMISRCYCDGTKTYQSYGARGIRVCDRWRESFSNFLADMGLRPKGTSLDRTNNNGNYEPSNCAWATRSQQCRNRRRLLSADRWITMFFETPSTFLAQLSNPVHRKIFTAFSENR